MGAEEFKKSELGQIVLGMARQDGEFAMEAFDKAPVTDQAKLIDAKVSYRVAMKFETYLEELITRGHEAMEAAKELMKSN